MARAPYRGIDEFFRRGRWNGRSWAGARSREGVGPQDLADARRSRHYALLGKGLVVRLDLVEGVEIVDHQSVRLLRAPSGTVAEEVQPLEPGAVPEMEPRHGIEGPALGVLRFQEIVGGGLRAVAVRTCSRIPSSLSQPGIVEDASEHSSPRCVSHAEFSALALALEPAGKAGNGRERHESFQVREFALEVLDHLLDQEVAE